MVVWRDGKSGGRSRSRVKWGEKETVNEERKEKVDEHTTKSLLVYKKLVRDSAGSVDTF